MCQNSYIYIYIYIFFLEEKKGDSRVQPLSHSPRYSWVSPRIPPTRKWRSETSTPHNPHWFLIHTLKLCNPHSAGMGCRTWAPDGDIAATYHFGTRVGGVSKQFMLLSDICKMLTLLTTNIRYYFRHIDCHVYYHVSII